MEFKNVLFSNQGTKQILIKNTFWLSLVEVVSKLVMFVVTVSLVNYMGPEGFGAYNFASSVVAITLIFSDLGVGTILQREIARDKTKATEYLGNALGIRVATSVLVLALTVMTLPFLGNNRNYGLLVVLTCFYCLSQQLGNVLNAVLAAFEKMESVFVARLTYYLGILIAASLTITFKLGINTLVLLYLAAGLFSAFISAYLVKRLGVRIVLRKNKEFWKEVLKESSPLFGFVACSHIYGNIDSILIARFFGNYQLGIYQAAYKILYAFQSVNLINAVTAPRITVLLHEKKDKTYNRLSKMFWGFSLAGLIPLAAAITWKSDLIIGLIYREKYLLAAPILGWLIWSGVVNYFRIYLTNILIARNKQRWVFYSVLAGLLVNLAMNVWGLPVYGFGFAAIALLVAEVVILLVAGVAVGKN